MNDASDTVVESRGGFAGLLAQRMPAWLALVLLLILLIVLLIWKQMAVSTAEARLAEERQTLTQQFEADKAAVLGQAREAVARNSEQAHRLVGQALSWAVRGELIRNNLDQIDQYFQELVKTERIRQVALVGNDGKVLLATDKKLQGSDFGASQPADLLNAETVEIRPAQTANENYLVMPVMGLNVRMGTAVLRYAADTGL